MTLSAGRVVFGCSFFTYCLQWSLFTYSCVLELLAYNWSVFTCSWSFLLAIRKPRLTSTLTDSKQRSSAITKKLRLLMKELPPLFFSCSCDSFVCFEGQKHGNGNVQANVRAKNSGQFEGTAIENAGFRGKKSQKVHPNFAPSITTPPLFHLCLCLSTRVCSEGDYQPESNMPSRRSTHKIPVQVIVQTGLQVAFLYVSPNSHFPKCPSGDIPLSGAKAALGGAKHFSETFAP